MYGYVFGAQIFSLIFFRIFAMMVASPVFSSSLIITRAKLLASFFIAVVIFPVVFKYKIPIPQHTMKYFLLILNEVLIGLIIGTFITIIFAAFQASASLFSIQLGFGINDVLDPLSQLQIPLVGQFQNLVALLVFLAIDGHHLLLKAIYKSFEYFPIIDMARVNVIHKGFVEAIRAMFEISLQIAFPIMGTIFVVSASLGVLAKAAPQMNIFMLGFPVKIAIGFIVMLAFLPFFVSFVNRVVSSTFWALFKLMIGGG